MYKQLCEHIVELEGMKNYPKSLYFSGDTALLQRKKVSIVGTRKPSKYTRDTIAKVAKALGDVGVVVVSGGAMGVDAIAHHGAGGENTIAVLPCGIDLRYPAVNKNLLNDIETNGLLLSQFDLGAKARPYSFVVRNELVVALGEVLIVGEAELESGTMRSVEYALSMGKKIYVLPHRLGESMATHKLLAQNQAEVIYDIEKFVTLFGDEVSKESDDFLEYCQHNPTYEEALKKFPSRLFEAELSGEIEVKNARIYPL